MIALTCSSHCHLNWGVYTAFCLAISKSAKTVFIVWISLTNAHHLKDETLILIKKKTLQWNSTRCCICSLYMHTEPKDPYQKCLVQIPLHPYSLCISMRITMFADTQSICSWTGFDCFNMVDRLCIAAHRNRGIYEEWGIVNEEYILYIYISVPPVFHDSAIAEYNAK